MNSFEKAIEVFNEVKKVVIGKDDCVVKTLCAILAGGHILINDIPGVGKTTLASAFAKALSLDTNRIQFTPDVLPSDIVGFNLYNKANEQFEFQQGAVMCQLLIADEINRTTPKTQSALLEVMEEKQVTVDTITYPLPKPFIVIATQNPFGSSGTQMLPDSQLDRFMISMSIGYPSMKHELDIVKGKNHPYKIRPVITSDELLSIMADVKEVTVSDEIYEYLGALVQATRKHPLIELGVSPRGTVAFHSIIKSIAFLRQRDYVIPEDVSDIFTDVALHRIYLNSQAHAAHKSKEEILKEIIRQTPTPSVLKRKGMFR